MARVASLNRSMLVVDTSYLTELFKVPGLSNDAAHDAIKARFEKAIKASSPVYVPFPVIFEVGNHIAHVSNGHTRKTLAKQFVDVVLQSIDKGKPFVITPKLEAESLKMLLDVFAKDFAHQGVGMTDASVIEEAERLKAMYGHTWKVHIWTKDRALKAREPDAEPNPFVV